MFTAFPANADSGKSLQIILFTNDGHSNVCFDTGFVIYTQEYFKDVSTEKGGNRMGFCEELTVT